MSDIPETAMGDITDRVLEALQGAAVALIVGCIGMMVACAARWVS
jgi:hypothetical protein